MGIEIPRQVIRLRKFSVREIAELHYIKIFEISEELGISTNKDQLFDEVNAINEIMTSIKNREETPSPVDLIWIKKIQSNPKFDPA
jgi:hypothetical protein